MRSIDRHTECIFFKTGTNCDYFAKMNLSALVPFSGVDIGIDNDPPPVAVRWLLGGRPARMMCLASVARPAHSATARMKTFCIGCLSSMPS